MRFPRWQHLGRYGHWRPRSVLRSLFQGRRSAAVLPLCRCCHRPEVRITGSTLAVTLLPLRWLPLQHALRIRDYNRTLERFALLAFAGCTLLLSGTLDLTARRHVRQGLARAQIGTYLIFMPATVQLNVLTCRSHTRMNLSASAYSFPCFSWPYVRSNQYTGVMRKNTADSRNSSPFAALGASGVVRREWSSAEQVHADTPNT